MNKVILMGNIGKDGDLVVSKSGVATLKFSLATNKKFKNKDGELQSQTEWHRVTFFGKQAEGLAQYMTKGKQVLVTGEIRTSTYEKDGEKRYSTDIVGDNLEFCGGGGSHKPDDEDSIPED